MQAWLKRIVGGGWGMPWRRARPVVHRPPPGRMAWLLLGLAWGSLPGCSTLQAPPLPSDALWHDALFQHPPRPAEADAVFTVDEPMRAYLRQHMDAAARHIGKPRALAQALYASGQLRLEYDASHTRSAAQAFAARAGNCLSLVVMTAALAQELGLEVSYQSAQVEQAFSRDADLTLQSGHVNLVLGPRRSGWELRTLGAASAELERLQIDFLPPEELRGLRSLPITQATVLAMFMNNRAAEALRDQQPATAYAWLREALRHDARFWPAYNTLGVAYQRAGHLAPAAAVFQHLLAQDHRNVAAMWNLAQVLQAQGRPDEAALWAARRAALEPVPPFQHLQQGRAALARGDAALARDELLAEQRLTGASHELYFWLAQAEWALGQPAQAQQALQQAISLSPPAALRERYAGKLAWLRAQAAGTQQPLSR